MSVFFLFLLLISFPVYAVETGDILDSDASVRYQYNGQRLLKTDSAPFVVESTGDKAPGAPGTSAAIDVWGPVASENSDKAFSLSQSHCRSNGSDIIESELSYANSSPLSLPANIPAQSRDIFKAGNPLIIRIVDLDENVDSNQIDSLTINLSTTEPEDSASLVLYETSNDSGEFVGIIQTSSASAESNNPNSNNCSLALSSKSILAIAYQDEQDQEDFINKIIKFDPYSRVFNAYTGEVIDGLTLRLIDNNTGSLAQVFGDDGISNFPAEVISGGQVQDASGKEYNFPAGSFRFPYVENGDYRIEINNSFAYRFPSQVNDSVLQALPSAPYELNNASRGSNEVSQNLLFSVDIPLDPLTDRVLLTKSTTKTHVGIGDFVPFTIKLTNVDADINDLQLIDTLPVGLRVIESSIKVNQQAFDAINVSDSGRVLSLNFTQLGASEVVTIDYVTQVANTAKGKITNRAEIQHQVLKSNIATATININDDFMREKSQVFGRVILDDCDGNLDAEGLSGIRLMMEDGRYVVTDEEGQWHFEGVKPGTHIIQLDTMTLPPYLELSTCDKEYFHAGQSYSQFIDLQPGSLWRADFHVQPKKPERGDVLQTLLNELVPLTEEEKQGRYRSPVSQKIIYTANIGGSGVALNNVIEEIRLPKGVMMKSGSLTLDGAPHPYEYRGNRIFVHIGDKPSEWSHVIKFSAIISSSAEKGTLSARAILHYEIGPIMKDSTPLAETRVNLFIPPADGNADPLKNPKFESLSNVLTVQDKNNLSDVIFALNGLKDLEISVTGHTDNIRIAKRNHHLYKNNQALSEARASSVAEYISQQIGLPLEKIKISGMGKAQPLASNATALGRSKNRRVEVRVLNATPEVALASLDVDVQLAKTETLIPGLDLYQATAAGNPEDQIIIKQQPEINDAWFADKRIEKDWVWPPADYSPDISATNILVQHPKNNRIRLTLNGVPVHSIYFEGIKRANGKAVSVSEWRGINIEEGENQFVAEILDRDENVIDYLAHSVYFSGAPAKAEILPEMSTLVADGIQVPIIAVRFSDKNGFPVRKNTQGELEISEPYTLLQRNEYDINPLSDTNKLSYRVEGDGIAFIRLQPTTQTGELTLTFKHNNESSDQIRTWLKPAARDWILIGLGDLAIGAHANTKQANKQSNGLIDEGIYHQGRLAFYTKGQIPGDYLITAAYDSAKEETTPFATLVQPGEYYTLYADASQQGQDASSGDKLYIKIEKERFYALYGDINTGLDKTKLSRYVRNLTGAQVVFQNDLIELSGFASETDSSFNRDEIQGNGTSGLYQLSNKFIVANSESIRIETRDRINNQVILNSKSLKRHLDYSLDENNGSLYFKTPIAATDNSFNPIYIVADYETENLNGNSSAQGHLIGGRGGVKFFNDSLSAGITLIDEDKNLRANQLTGLDAKLDLGNLTLSAELAQTRPRGNTNSADTTSSDSINSQNASAKRLEAKLTTASAEISAYSQRVDQGFGLSQQNQADLDLQITGVNSKLHLSEQDILELDGLYQSQISSGLDKQQGQVIWSRNLTDSSTINVGVLSSIQETQDGITAVDELNLGASAPVLNQNLRLNFNATTDITERSEENDRIKLGAEYRWADSLTTFADYERSFNRNNLERSAIGLRTQPWQGGQVEQSLVQESQDDGYRLFSESGLSHDWKLDEHWLVSFGFNQSKNIEQALPAEQTATEDFHAVSSGWGYRSQQWQWTNRLERRIAQSSQTHSAHTSLYHPLNSAMAIGGSINFYKLNNTADYEQNLDATLDFAIRPRKQPFALLLQTRWLQDELTTSQSASKQHSRRIINNAHLNWKFNGQNQLASQYGIKRILDQYNEENYGTTVHYLAAEWRHQLSNRWDAGLHGRELINQGQQQQNSYGFSIGARPAKNLWTSIGYNFEGFVDNDFSAANYTAHGIYLKLRFKADQDTLASLRQAFK